MSELKVHWPSGHICDEDGRHIATVHLEGWSKRQEIGNRMASAYNFLTEVEGYNWTDHSEKRSLELSVRATALLMPPGIISSHLTNEWPVLTKGAGQ